MSVVRALQITCSAEKSLAECERNAAALLAATQPGEKAGEVAKATVRAKSARPAKKVEQRLSAADKASGGGRGEREPAGPSQGHGQNGHDDVESVAELIAIICIVPENRKKRVKLAEALRERGLDESKVAAIYSGVAEKLSRNKESGAVGVAAAKLLFDVLKELADRLEPEKSAGNNDANEAPQFVRLIHNVPRPVRTE
jgi:hypothetical protein